MLPDEARDDSDPLDMLHVSNLSISLTDCACRDHGDGVRIKFGLHRECMSGKITEINMKC